ncbi:unnamed protein product [Protopolystoma xenopodis]|uniref:Uncharacterized protein n=1 Tax=Protopolystoma xenopodis TaxID=117903 RepID=A0A448WW70_9PLAT|nr:unnamed protein product [Protopolystoma xenopodis]
MSMTGFKVDWQTELGLGRRGLELEMQGELELEMQMGLELELELVSPGLVDLAGGVVSLSIPGSGEQGQPGRFQFPYWLIPQPRWPIILEQVPHSGGRLDQPLVRGSYSPGPARGRGCGGRTMERQGERRFAGTLGCRGRRLSDTGNRTR